MISKRLKGALTNALARPENSHLRQAVQRRNIPLEQVSVTILDDDYELDGDVYAGGKCCKTIGEIKAAHSQDMGGWSG